MKANQTFATRTQRFRAGEDVPAGTDLTPHTEDSLRDAAVIGDEVETSAKPTRRRRKSKTEN